MILAIVVTLKLVASAAAVFCAFMGATAIAAYAHEKRAAGVFTHEKARQHGIGAIVVFTVLAVIMLLGVWVAP